MTEQEFNKKIEDINAEQGDPEDRRRRIALVTETFNNGVAASQEEKRLSQEAAESELRYRLKESYLSNPAATEADFEKDYSALRSQHLQSSALERERVIRTSQEELTRAAF